ncbi:MAG TPA: hypothetical protein VKA60_04000 [Blastocatellia bacterium]|nr:hypothetical protein [Blastocatellia bacterium]
MFFNQASKKTKRPAGKATTTARGAASRRKLYSVPVWLRERVFAGEFDLGGKSYKLTFAPAQAEIADRSLRLRGRLTVNDGRGGEVKDASAQLAGIQGGIGQGPARYKMLATGATPGPTQSPTEKEQKSGENEKKAGEPTVPERARTSGLPVTENTGPTAYAAVMFFHLEPLDQRALAVPADLSRVQLNARLAPTDRTALALHSLYTAITHALAGDQADERLAAALVRELNQVLAG